MNIFSNDINKPRLKTTLNEIKNIFKNCHFLVQKPEKGEPMTPWMGVYKAKIQSDGSLENINLRIVVRVDL